MHDHRTAHLACHGTLKPEYLSSVGTNERLTLLYNEPQQNLPFGVARGRVDGPAHDGRGAAPRDGTLWGDGGYGRVFAEAALSGSGSAGGDRSARVLGEAEQRHCGD